MSCLHHSSKGTTWQDHKYVAKVTKNGKITYIYTDERKYLPTSERYYDKMTTMTDIIKDDMKDWAKDLKTDIKNAGNTLSDLIAKPSLERGKQFCNNFAKETAHLGNAITNKGKEWLNKHKWW